jgi:hypothetical protein
MSAKHSKSDIGLAYRDFMSTRRSVSARSYSSVRSLRERPNFFSEAILFRPQGIPVSFLYEMSPIAALIARCRLGYNVSWLSYSHKRKRFCVHQDRPKFNSG